MMDGTIGATSPSKKRPDGSDSPGFCMDQYYLWDTTVSKLYSYYGHCNL